MPIRVREVARQMPNRVVYEVRVGSALVVRGKSGAWVCWIGSSMVGAWRDQSAQLEFRAPPRPYICHLHHRNTKCRVSGNGAFGPEYDLFGTRVGSLLAGINNTRSDDRERTSLSMVGDFFAG